MLLYIPAVARENAGQASSGSDGVEREGGAEKQNAEGNAAAEAPPADQDAMDIEPASKPLRARDTDCHVLGVVSQGQHESITVRVLTPALGQTTQRPPSGEGMGRADPPTIYNPATGRPEGFLLPRDRRRMTRLAKALNAQLTNWTVRRLMSLTTLHREFQVWSRTSLRIPALVLASCFVAVCFSFPG